MVKKFQGKADRMSFIKDGYFKVVNGKEVDVSDEEQKREYDSLNKQRDIFIALAVLFYSFALITPFIAFIIERSYTCS
jgi:hypothetical protein